MQSYLSFCKLANRRILSDAIETAKVYEADMDHALQDAKLSVRLFDGLKELIPAESARADLLIYAAVLHDIGWIGGQTKHHKRSMELILGNPPEGLSASDTAIVAQIARYHRKSPPKTSHTEYMRLSSNDKRTVCCLASLLRIADGLDCAHDSAAIINDIKLSAAAIDVHLTAGDNAHFEIESAYKKSDLLEQTFGRKLMISQSN